MIIFIFRDGGRAEKEMVKKDDKNFLMEVLLNFPVGIGIFDSQLNLLYSNHHFKELLGEKIEDREFIKKLFETRSKGASDYFHKDNKIIGYTPYLIEDKQVLLMKDMTESIYTLDLEKNRKLNDTINYIFSMVRHEIGNPINTIKVSISVLNENLEEYSKDKIREYISRLKEETERMEKILSALKDFSRYGVVKIERINLKEVLEKTIYSMKPLARSKGTMLFLSEPADVEVEADSVALMQVLSNIIKNAIEALENKEGEKMIQLYTSVDEKFVRIHIIDNGPGIPPELTEKVFMPFFTTKNNGTGMGLAICKGLITAMNGWIGLINTGNGTMAIVTLPKKHIDRTTEG